MPNSEIFHSKSRDPFIAIVLSIVIASILTIYPVSYGLAAWRPCVMFAVMLFWMLCQPTWCGVWFAFAMGIFTDLLIDAPLGLNALVFVLISFVIRFYTQDRSIMAFWNLWFVSGLSILVYKILLAICYYFIDPQMQWSRYWQGFVSSVMMWPILFYSLHKWRHL